ncbi:hypothetical protein BJV74DRAFT_116020 [Russula compacta]|nr:hypothetical protein BJV74DRAFT_116020 [Russula compacta]
MSSPIPPNIAEIAAPTLFGEVWNWALYGVLAVQVYVYNYNFPEDRKVIKVLVYSLFFIETLQTAMSGADLYYWFVSGFGQIDRLTHPNLAAFDVPIVEVVIAVTVQYFFAYRVWVLSNKKSWWLYLVVSVSSLASAAGALMGATYAFIHDRFLSGEMLRVASFTWLIGNAVADILITASMLYYLTRRRTAGDGYFSDNVLSKIIRLTVETNLMTCTVGVIALLLAFVYPDKDWYDCPIAILGKLYSNTLLVSLNNRVSFREVSPSREVTHSFRTVTVPSSNDASSIGHLELEKVSTSV